MFVAEAMEMDEDDDEIPQSFAGHDDEFIFPTPLRTNAGMVGEPPLERILLRARF